MLLQDIPALHVLMETTRNGCNLFTVGKGYNTIFGPFDPIGAIKMFSPPPRTIFYHERMDLMILQRIVQTFFRDFPALDANQFAEILSY